MNSVQQDICQTALNEVAKHSNIAQYRVRGHVMTINAIQFRTYKNNIDYIL